MAGLGTDGPPSLLHAGPAGPSKHEAAVVGGHKPDEVQREDGQAVFEGLAHTHLPHNAQGEQRTAWRARGGFFEAILFKKMTQVHISWAFYMAEACVCGCFGAVLNFKSDASVYICLNYNNL